MDWEEKFICPHCENEHSYDVYGEIEGTEGLFNLKCEWCSNLFEVSYYPVIEFGVSDIDV